MKRILTIAGSDSGGGAGIQADLKTITLLGGFGMSALTALTAQNTVAVEAIHEIPLDFIEAQIDAVFSDIGVDAVKTGMLSNAGVVQLVADKLAQHKPPIVVVDPVMVAKSGDPLLADDARETLAGSLLPLATLVTPNLPEASALIGWEVGGEEDMRRAAEEIYRLGPKYVLVKGGHLQGEPVDLLFDAAHIARRERRTDQTAIHRVLGRIHGQEERGDALDLDGHRVQRDPLLRGEQLGMLADIGDVGPPGERPEARLLHREQRRERLVPGQTVARAQQRESPLARCERLTPEVVGGDVDRAVLTLVQRWCSHRISVTLAR